MEERNISEQESLRLIQEMIGKAKDNYHESGASAILWGAVIGACGLVSFAELQWNFSIGFDIWFLILAAIIPGVWFNIRDSKRSIVKTHEEVAVDIAWSVFGISITCLVIYVNVIPALSERFFASEHLELLSHNTVTGETKPYRPSTLSITSVFLIIYAFPTLITGWLSKFKPMIIGAIACYCFFVISLFTSFKYDMLLSGLAGIGNWLIPGLILNKRHRKAKSAHV